MKKGLKHIFWDFLIIIVVLAVTVVIHNSYASNTIIITPDNPDWWFAQETPTGSGTFVTGPSTPPLGNGSLELTVDSTGGEIFGTFTYAGTRLDTIKSLSYSTYRVSGAPALAPHLDFDVDTDVTDTNTSWQGRLAYEPYYTNTVSTGVWQTWNPLDNSTPGNWWFSGAPGNSVCPISSPCTWAQILADFPNIGIRSAGPNTGALQFKAGGGWTGGFVGNVDAFSIGIGNVVTTYDFEPPPPPATLHVIKVVADGSGTSTPSDFNVYVKNIGVNVSGSPAPGTSTPGTLYSLPAGMYTISEDANALFTSSFTGDCDSLGGITLSAGDDKVCTITNTVIPVAIIPVPAPAINANASTNGGFSSRGGGGGGGVTGGGIIPTTNTVIPNLPNTGVIPSLPNIGSPVSVKSLQNASVIKASATLSPVEKPALFDITSEPLISVPESPVPFVVFSIIAEVAGVIFIVFVVGHVGKYVKSKNKKLEKNDN